MKIAALCALAFSLFTAGLAMDEILNREDCSPLIYTESSTTAECAGSWTFLPEREHVEWGGAGLSFFVCLVLFRSRPGGATTT